MGFPKSVREPTNTRSQEASRPGRVRGKRYCPENPESGCSQIQGGQFQIGVYSLNNTRKDEIGEGKQACNLHKQQSP